MGLTDLLFPVHYFDRISPFFLPISNHALFLRVPQTGTITAAPKEAPLSHRFSKEKAMTFSGGSEKLKQLNSNFRERSMYTREFE